MKFGVAGTGSFTDRVVIPGINASGLASVVALFGRTPERVAKMAEDHRIPNEFDSYEKMLELEDLDAVAVCTPNFLHVPMADAALSAGKAVLSEKPLGLDSSETLRLARRAAALGIGNAVNFTYRSMPPFVLAGEMIRAGEIGELISGSINYCQANWADPSLPLDWRMSAKHSGRGALADLGSHAIDLLLCYGGDVESVAGADSIASGPRPVDSEGTAVPTASDSSAFICDLGGGGAFLPSISPSWRGGTATRSALRSWERGVRYAYFMSGVMKSQSPWPGRTNTNSAKLKSRLNGRWHFPIFRPITCGKSCALCRGLRILRLLRTVTRSSA